MNRDDYLSHDAVGLAGLIARGEIAPHEALEACLAQLAAVNPTVNAVVGAVDEEAVARAKKAPKGAGPFAGLPYFIKDLHAPVAGLPLAHGSRAFADSVFDFDAETVARLRRAGFSILGRTNSPELGLTATTEPKLHGATRNPWGLDRSAGGSSGGAGAAVAAGILPATHATDSGGSIRIPASVNGLVGLKPTRGLLPSGPHRGDPNFGLSHEHAVTRTVRDCAAILDVTAGPDAGAPYRTLPPAEPFREAIRRPPGKLRIAVTTRAFASGEDADPEITAQVAQAARLLAHLGHEVEDAAPDIDGAGLRAALLTVLYASLTGLVDARAAQLGRAIPRDWLEPTTWAALDFGRAVSVAQFVGQFPIINRAVRGIGRFFADYDVLVTPVLTRPTAKLGELTTEETDIARFNERVFGYAAYCYPFNATGQPAVSLPIGTAHDGMPIGVQFVGRFAEDTVLLQLAQTLQDEIRWHEKLSPAARG